MARQYDEVNGRPMSGRRTAPQGRARGGQAAQEGHCPVAGDDRGPHDRHHLLGQGVVRQPGELSRLREPPGARPHLCAQRLGARPADRAAQSRRWSADRRLYDVKVTHQRKCRTAQWRSICADCAGGIDSLVELLQGRFSKGVMERICRQDGGLFPKPSEISFSCSCPDYASMCKHVAAALYGVGARLDAKPELLFRLRGVNENDLLADIGSALPLTKQGPAGESAGSRRHGRTVRPGHGRSGGAGRDRGPARAGADSPDSSHLGAKARNRKITAGEAPARGQKTGAPFLPAGRVKPPQSGKMARATRG